MYLCFSGSYFLFSPLQSYAESPKGNSTTRLPKPQREKNFFVNCDKTKFPKNIQLQM